MDAIRQHRRVSFKRYPVPRFVVNSRPMMGIHRFIDLFLVKKRPSYIPDPDTGLSPYLVPDGVVCPCQPMWPKDRLMHLDAVRREMSQKDPPSRDASIQAGCAIGRALVSFLDTGAISASQEGEEVGAILQCLKERGLLLVGAEVPIADMSRGFATEIDAVAVKTTDPTQVVVLEIKRSHLYDFGGSLEKTGAFFSPFHHATNSLMSRAGIQACLAAATLTFDYNLGDTFNVKWAVIRVFRTIEGLPGVTFDSFVEGIPSKLSVSQLETIPSAG